MRAHRLGNLVLDGVVGKGRCHYIAYSVVEHRAAVGERRLEIARQHER